VVGGQATGHTKEVSNGDDEDMVDSLIIMAFINVNNEGSRVLFDIWLGGEGRLSMFQFEELLYWPFLEHASTVFHPDKSTHCPHCGVKPQTVPHVIKHCPHYAAARATFLTPAAADLSLATLFGTREGGAALIQFLEATKARFTPKKEPDDPGWLPPGPGAHNTLPMMKRSSGYACEFEKWRDKIGIRGETGRVITCRESYFIAQRVTARRLGFASHNKGWKSTGQKKTTK
jgi:hypothetical protein